MNLTSALLQALAARGATEIFGIPGDFALPLFGEIERSGLLPVHTLSHEPGVGFAADAAARARGGLGVAAVTYGAGAFNLANAVAGAYAERVPVVVLSGAPAAHEATSGYLLHHQVKTLDSQWRVFSELTVDQARLDDARQAPGQIARVLDNALAHSRPVYLEIPRDMPAVACAPVPPPVPPGFDPDRLAACADELLGRLRSARQPVLMAGIEVRRYRLEAKVAELARRLDIPVVTNVMGVGLMAEEDISHAGTYLGLAGDPQVSALVEHSDGLLLLGVIVSDTNFAVSARRIDIRHAIHVFDGDIAMGHHVYRELPIAALVDALLDRLPAPGGERVSPSPNGIDHPAGTPARDDAPVVFADGCNGDLGATSVDAARVERCTYGTAGGDRTVVLVGDSHAAQWQPALAVLAADAGVRLVVLTKSACPIADLTVDNQLLGRPYRECDTWRDDVVALLGELEPDLAIVTSTSHYEAHGPDGSEADAGDWAAGLTRTLEAVAASGPTIFLGDTPYPAGDVPACLAEHLSDATACTLSRGQVPFDYARVEAQAASDAGVPLVPTVDLVCGAQRCPVIVGRQLVYRDASHLATPYVTERAPVLAGLLEGAASRLGSSVLLGG